ncbi:Uncharacterized protein APZ42_030179 [Daphnia magna]|uniref:CCHC-type domain-containing protein n=1 Tax=Daphnia magna TaxID=35525 RepID=A0A164NZL1_9CRUS|nr:Uncharacterized protein APZ42_030179 [Daphnia magna]
MDTSKQQKRNYTQIISPSSEDQGAPKKESTCLDYNYRTHADSLEDSLLRVDERELSELTHKELIQRTLNIAYAARKYQGQLKQTQSFLNAKTSELEKQKQLFQEAKLAFADKVIAAHTESSQRNEGAKVNTKDDKGFITFQNQQYADKALDIIRTNEECQAVINDPRTQEKLYPAIGLFVPIENMDELKEDINFRNSFIEAPPREVRRCYKCNNCGHTSSHCKAPRQPAMEDNQTLKKEHPMQSKKFLQINLRHCEAASALLAKTIDDYKVDIVMIQEPYATKRLDHYDLKYIPEGFTAFHNLSDQHPYGSVILVNNGIKAHMEKCSSNEVVVVKIGSEESKFLLICAYCRPSSPSISLTIKSYLKTYETELKRAVICMDSNAKSPVWNSHSTDKKGKELENLIARFFLKVENANADSLNFIPAGTAFVDVTLLGGDTNTTSWQFLQDHSLSDHPYIFFLLSQTPQAPGTRTAKKPPREGDIDADLYMKNLTNELSAHDVIQSNLKAGDDIDKYVEAMSSIIISSANKSKNKNKEHRPRPLAPWWTEKLGRLRNETRKAFKKWSRFHRTEDQARFKEARGIFKKHIRQAKRDSFKKIISDMNGNANSAFREIKKSARSATSTQPKLEINVNGLLTADLSIVTSRFAEHFFHTEGKIRQITPRN